MHVKHARKHARKHASTQARYLADSLNSIPTKILKDNADICSGALDTSFNESLNNGDFPNELKLADITPI